MRAQGAAPGAQFEHARRFLLVSYAKVVSIVNELPSCSDADCSLEPMSDPEEEEEDMPDDTDTSRSGVGDRTRHPKSFETGEDAIVGNKLSLHTASKSGQSSDSTRDNLIWTVMSSAGPIMISGGTIRHS